MIGVSDTKTEQLHRLRCIEGQVRGITRMVEEDQYCIDILTQFSAASRALKSVALDLLTEHVDNCLVNAVLVGGAEQEAKLKEVSVAIARLVRS